MNDDRIQVDRMRYTKNTTSSRLVLLAIIFNVLYFVSIYKLDIYEPRIRFADTTLNNSYYTIYLGGSIIFNLVFMLVAFLCSEGVKNYRKSFSVVLIVLAVLQIVRIFLLPNMLHGAYLFKDESAHTEQYVFRFLSTELPAVRHVTFMSDWQFIRVSIYMVASAVCLFIAARINAKKSSALAAHVANLESLQA